MDPKLIFPFAVNRYRNNIIPFDGVIEWGYTLGNQDYIDLSLGSCGCFPLGFARSDFSQHVQDRLNTFPHLSGDFLSTNNYIIDLADQIYTLSNGYRSIFTLSGSDAVETAIKVARQSQQNKKPLMLGFANSYHGSTQLSASISGSTYLHQTYGRDANCITLPWDLDQVEQEIRQLGSDNICCLIVESCSWQAGLYSFDDAWWQRLQKLCNSNDIVFIVDDIAFCGAKTEHFFGFNQTIQPDIVCVGKAFSAGYYPLAGCLVNDRIYNAIKDLLFLHGFTNSFNMAGILSTLHYLDVIKKENILDQQSTSRSLANTVFKNFTTRNYGLTWCLDITHNKDSSEVFKIMLDNGLYMGLWNSNPNRLLISVPNTIDINYYTKLEQRLNSAIWKLTTT